MSSVIGPAATATATAIAVDSECVRTVEQGWVQWRPPLPPKLPGTPRREHRPRGWLSGDWIIAGNKSIRWRGGKVKWVWLAKEKQHALESITVPKRIGRARINVLVPDTETTKPAEIRVTLALAGGAR